MGYPAMIQKLLAPAFILFLSPLASTAEDAAENEPAKPAEGALQERLQRYFQAAEEERDNSAAYWGALDQLSEDQVEPAREAIFEAAKAKAIADGREKQFRKGEILTVVSKDEEQWWTARNSLGQTGSIPVPYGCKVE